MNPTCLLPVPFATRKRRVSDLPIDSAPGASYNQERSCSVQRTKEPGVAEPIPKMVPAVERAIRILQLFRSADDSYGVSELTRELALNKSTVFDIVTTLTAFGYLERDESTKKYHLGSALFRLGYLVGDAPSLYEIARPFLRGLADQFSATMLLVQPLPADELLILACAEPATAIKLSMREGSRLPVGRGVFRQLLLAGQPSSLLSDDLLAGKRLFAPGYYCHAGTRNGDRRGGVPERGASGGGAHQRPCRARGSLSGGPSSDGSDARSPVGRFASGPARQWQAPIPSAGGVALPGLGHWIIIRASPRTAHLAYILLLRQADERELPFFSANDCV